jgi:nucleoside-diphosphate-sugar epimerase/lipopolysaccharide/colanic/teichoic acid biosynthesis glycosyltransferase
VFALVAFVIALPLMLVLAGLSALMFRAAPLFRQERVGLDGRWFTLSKIRSLPADTAQNAPKYDLLTAENGRFGRFIRRTHLDELPQLWLVVIGKMALVGPRPEMPDLAARFDPAFARRRVTTRPGCTGLWQLSPEFDRLIGEAPEYDLFYVGHANLRLDLWILARTLMQFARPSTRVTLDDIPRWTGCVPASGSRDDDIELVDVFRVVERDDAPSELHDLRLHSELPDPVVVAGAGGFIGGYVVKRLVAEGHAVRAVDIKPLDRWYQFDPTVDSRQLDLRDSAMCREAVSGASTVLNFAADMGGMGFIENNKALCMLSVLINTNLLMAAREEAVARYFFASSACVYPTHKQVSPEAMGLREFDAYPAMPEDGYGWEKLFSERMCRHFREDFGVETRVGRFHNVYGPHGSFVGGREKAPAAICRKVAEAVVNGTDWIEIWGDGCQARSFTFIDDGVEGALRLTGSSVTEALNIGSAELVTINGLVDLVESIAGTRLERRYRLDAPQGVRGRNSDNALVLDRLGWQPSVSLRSGMEATYAWVFEQVARVGVEAGV